MIIVLAIHLVAVDLAMAGPLVAIGLQWRARRRGDGEASNLARRLGLWSIGGAVLGIALGFVTLLLAPHVESAAYRQALAKIPAARWWFVAAELVFYLVCMVAYVGLWRRMQHRPVWHALLAVLAATDLMYHFPPLFAVVSSLSVRPQLSPLPLDHALFWRVLLMPQTLAMVLHHWLAGISVAAMTAVLLNMVPTPGHWPAANGASPQVATSKWAGRVALAATLSQLAVGIWLLLAVPAGMQNALLGEDWLATGLFAVAVILALGLMHHLAMIALGDVRRGAIIRAAAMMFATILTMTGTLQRARHLAERPAAATQLTRPSSLARAPHA